MTGNPCIDMLPAPSPFAACQGTCGLTIAKTYLCEEHSLCGPCHD